MYCIAHCRVLPNLAEKERQQLLTQAHLHTLVEMLEAIPDPRGKHGLRYDLPYLLSPKILVEYTVSSISITQPSIRQLSAGAFHFFAPRWEVVHYKEKTRRERREH